MKKVFIILILVVALVSILAACATTPSQTTTSAQTTVPAQTTTSAKPAASAPATLTPKYGGVLRLVVRSPSNYFGFPGDMASSGGSEVSTPCLENLVYLDAKGKFEPTGLVTAYEVAQDGKSVTFTLRQGVKFQDGTDFNARAAQWCLEQGMKARLPGTELFTSVDTIGDYNIRVNVEHFDNRVFQAVADAKVSSPAAYEKYGRSEISTHPVGTGPFKIVSFSPDVGITWERFDDYWGGKPYLDGIQSFIIADEMAKLAALQSGDVDLLLNVNTESALSLKSKGYNVAAGNLPTLWTLLPDSINENSPLSKLPVRQAIEYAINRDELAKLGSGFWEAAYQTCEPTSQGYISDFKGRQYNVSKARELLAQAGYPDGFDTTIIFGNTQLVMDQMVAIQQMLSMAGIKVDVRQVDRNMKTSYQQNGWQNAFIPLGMFIGPSQYLSALNYGLGGASFVSLAKPPEWKDAYNEACYADQAGIDAACKNLIMMLYDNATVIPLYVAPQCIYAMPDYVHDTHIYESGNLYRWTPEKAWLSK